MNPKSKHARIVAEIREIAARHGGVVNPHTVVRFAENPKTALHGQFTWDDGKAAHEYRLWQARQIIRVTVEVIEGRADPIRAFVSLREDRNREAGYRYLVSVLGNARQRATMLEEALRDLAVLEAKYRGLSELADVFTAARRVRRGAKPRAAGAALAATAQQARLGQARHGAARRGIA